MITISQWKKSIIWVNVLLFTACIEPYELPHSTGESFFLVVDGGLNIEEGTGQVRLSRAQNLADTTSPWPERRADVFLEEGSGNLYPFTPRWDGTYTLERANLAFGQPYRLRIHTRDGKEYASEIVMARHRTPAIDSLTWEVIADEVHLQVNTHDPENSTWYYRWELEETWHYTSGAYSHLIYRAEDSSVVFRDDDVYRCYRTEIPSAILVATSNRLTRDVISRFPLKQITGNSPRFRLKYSYLVRQFAISQEEYAYWQMLKKNTEEVGTLFDAQPSQVTGNMRCLTHPEEPVLGFFSARSVQTKRLFIRPDELQPYGFRWRSPACEIDTIPAGAASAFAGSVEFLEALYPRGVPVFRPTDYTVTAPSCADCRLQGGTNVKPDFWE